MDGMEDYGGGEFIFDSEENTPSPLPILHGYDDNAGDALKVLDTAAVGEEGGYLSPSLTFATPALEASPQSANGSHDSLSDSSSSKRTQSTTSTKTTFTGGDVMMSDGPDAKESWEFSDFIHGDDDAAQDGAFQLTEHAFDESTNLSAIHENAFTPAHSTVGMKSGITSATSSPSPFAMTADALSPPMSTSQGSRIRKLSPPVTKGTRGHNKGNSQFSLDQAMGGLNTNGSREVSPFSNMATSQNSSPAAFRASPSPSATFNFIGIPGGLPNLLPADGQDSSQWSQALGLNPNSLQQNSIGAGFQIPGQITTPGPFGYHLPMQMPYVGPGTQKYSLTVHPTPPKSRVETQIPIKLSLTPLPPGIKRLHLPTYTISKPKLLVKPTPEPSPDMLELHTVLVCTSAMQKPEIKERALQRALATAMTPRACSDIKKDPDKEDDKPIDGGEVHICNGCVLRERKRAARKKVKKPEDEKLWQEDEVRRVIVFNTNEVKEWQQPNTPDQPMGPFQVDAPMRIACYCRHHNEKSGFQVIFTITDYCGHLIAQCLSPSIMITDDHKTHAFPQVQGGPTTSADMALPPPVPAPTGPLSTTSQTQDLNPLSPPEQQYHLSPSSTDLASAKRNSVAFAPGIMSPTASQPNSATQTPKSLSRPASPTSHHGPMNKKRKSSGGPTKVPSTLTMTRLDTSNLPVAQNANATATTASTSTSPFSPSLTAFPGQQEQQSLFTATPTAHPPAPLVQTFVNGPTTPGTSEQPPVFANLNRTTSVDHLAIAQMYSAPASTHPSRPSSPTGMRAGPPVTGLQQQNTNFAHAQALAASLSPYNIPPRPPSVIHKIVPSEGPKSGGVEVTILGGGFFQGLEVMFGANKATTTTYWGESSLVCLLPPSAVSGLVPVTLSSKQQPSLSPQQYHKQPMFRYIDDDEQQILRTALSIMGHKMTGTFQDAAEIARKIIGDSSTGNWRSSASSAPAPLNVLALNGDFEAQLLKILDLIDLDDSPHKARYNLRRSTGQTMLHLACSMGLNRFVAGLLARGANPDIRDKGGYTALHMAALNDHPEIVRRLILNGADPTIRTLSGLSASDVSQSHEVLRAVKRVERHVRSRSGGSLQHSRANSASSLKSLWGLSQVALEGPDSSEESLEYTSEDMASEDEDGEADDGMWMGTRRTSVHDIRTSKAVPDQHPALNSPSAAVTALKEQFAAQLQQIHENFSLRLQNLPQFPYLPQMPVMPPLPDYQAAVMQRLASIVPNINITRPGSGDQPHSAKELDGRWWDLSSLMAPTGTAPPPAYNEIFPQTQRDLDMKQASAAQAAAEAEADEKCTAMYDTQATISLISTSGSTNASTSSLSADTVESSHATPQLPALLQIGRKNAVTREQQENLRRAHAEKLKRLRADRNLFFIWIPLLIIVMTAMLYNRFPGLFSALGGFIALVFSYVAQIGSSTTKAPAAAEPLATTAAKMVEV